MIPSGSTPELILCNGNFRTMDRNRPRVQAVAIGGGRILDVGDDQTIRAMAGAGTRSIDLNGRLGLPGLMDAHIHFYDWALGRQQLTLEGVKSFAEFRKAVAQAARAKPEGSWIVGQGWNEADWPEHRLPTREDLDAAAPLHPVALWRCDLHLVSVNSRALALAGIDADTPDPPDGAIDKDPSGRPTGILRELAANLIRAAIPEPTGAEIVGAMQEGIAHLHSLGLTGIHDVRLMGGLEGAPALRAWQLINEKGALDLRCWVSLPGERLDEAIALGLRTGFGDDRLRLGHLKYFADGGMGARTAWMLDAYRDAEYGMPLSSMAQLSEAALKAERAGLAVMIHAIGDRASREVITLFEELQQKRSRADEKNGVPPALGHRIEHIQMIRSEDISRLADMDVAACLQPYNMILDINMIDESVGHRGRRAYAFKALIDAGVPVLFSSDAPVCDPNPLLGIHAAVTRQRTDGTPAGGWYPEQRIGVETAVRSYTTIPARFYGCAHELGSVTPGKRADLIVLDRDIFRVDPMEIAAALVDLTIFDGKVAFHR